MGARILGIGTALPAHAMAQRDAAEAAAACCATTDRHARVLPEIFRRSTVRGRFSTLIRPHPDARIDAACVRWFYPPAHADTTETHDNGDDDDRARSLGPTTAQRIDHYRRHAPDLAEAACRRALADAGIAPPDVTHLITVTCTGFASPGVEFELMRRLGLPRTVGRTQIGFMGCHAALNGLQVARAVSTADPAARVLMCCVELCTLHFQYGWESQRIVANALFADGAAAAVVGRDPAAASDRCRLVDTCSRLFDDTEDEMSWHIGDHGFVMTLSPRVPMILAQRVRPWVEAWLGGHGLGVGDIGSWAIHPGGPRIIGHIGAALGLDDAATEASHAVLRRCGNMSSATVLFILERLRRDGARRPIVAMSFGPGLVAEAALLG